MLVNQEYIKFMDLTNDEIDVEIKLNLKKQIDYVYFYKSIQLLFLFYEDNSNIIYIRKKQIIYSINDNFTIIYSNFLRKENKKLYIKIITNSYIHSFIIKLIKECDDISFKKESDNLFSKKFKKIYTKSYLDFANIIIQKDDLKKNKYLEIPEIENALHDNYSLS